MVSQVIWSSQAQKDRKEILHYWRVRNKSNLYSKKLNRLFKTAARVLAEHPYIGRRTDIKNIRVKIVKDYLIIYKETQNRIEILSIWDSRRNPEELERRLK